MKLLKFIIVALLTLTTTQAMSQKAQVIGISHSDFVEWVYPNMRGPVVILFGSNYCGYSRQQLKILKQVLTNDDGSITNYISFYSVNIDTWEDDAWLSRIYDDDEDEQGTPTWVFYYLDEDGDLDYYYVTGNMDASYMRQMFRNLKYDSYYIND